MKVGSRAVESMLAASYGVIDERLLRFRGRLDHLRRLGCPSGVNTGKGRAAEYGWSQMLQVSLALSLIDLGVSPDHAARCVIQNYADIERAMAAWIILDGNTEIASDAIRSGKWPVKDTIFLYGSAHALAGMKADGALDPPFAVVVTLEKLGEWLAEANDVVASNFLIDIGAKVAMLVSLASMELRMHVDVVIEDFLGWNEEILDQLAGDLDVHS